MSTTGHPTSSPSTAAPTRLTLAPVAVPTTMTPWPTWTLAPTLAPTAAITTFTGLTSALGANDDVIAAGGVISFETTVELSTMDRWHIRGGNMRTIFDAGGERRLFELTKNATLILDGVTVQNGRDVAGNGCGFRAWGGCIYARQSSLELRNAVVRNCVSYDGGAFYFEMSYLNAINTTFETNTATNVGGLMVLTADQENTLSDEARFDATDCVFRDNKAEFGGVLWADRSFVTFRRCAFFDENEAIRNGEGGVIFAQTAEIKAIDSSFRNNLAGEHGGVAALSRDARFAVEDCYFENNQAAGDDGLTTIESDFTGDFTAGGDIVYLKTAAIVELYNSEIEGRTDGTDLASDFGGALARCDGQGTIHAAELTFDVTDRFIATETENCVIFLYQTNNDGSEKYKESLLGELRQGDAGTVNFVHWSVPCSRGMYSSDGIDHGDFQVDVNGNTINDNDPYCTTFGSPPPRCAAPCQTCPGGKYLEFTLNRYLHLGAQACTDCPVGRYLEHDAADDDDADDENPIRRWWLHDELEDCLVCPTGRFASAPGSATCTECAAGSYADTVESTACKFVNPGTFVVNKSATPEECPPGRFSVGGSNESECALCPVGEIQPAAGQASCIACPAPMTTIGQGSAYCDACIRSYFFNTLFWEENKHKTLSPEPDRQAEQCVECCVRCEDICDKDDDDDCVSCDDAGQVLESLDIQRGWWRATKDALKVYECDLERACRGGRSSDTEQKCFRGHIGALCGACDDGFDYDIARNRCAKCVSTRKMIARAGNLFMLIVFLSAVVALLLYAHGKKWHFKVMFLVMQEQARGGLSLGSEVKAMDHFANTVDEEFEQRVDDVDVKRRRRSLRRSLLTKLKIIVAAWQIASSTQHIYRQIRFPDIFAQMTQVFGFLGVAIFDVGSFNCAIGWSYFEKLLFVTLVPLELVTMAIGLVWVIHHVRPGGRILKTDADKRLIASRITYATLLFIFVALPSISTYVITYFSCINFEERDDRELKVIASELSISCTSTRYKKWTIYVALMIIIWPVGATLGIATLLWSNRSNLNPKIPTGDTTDEDSDSDEDDDTKEDESPREVVTPMETGGIDGFERQRRRHAKVMIQLEKINLRDANEALAGLEFVFEEYEPRCYLFPVFELVRRLFLSAVLAVFYPGSGQQIVIGLLGAMCSYVVYSHYEAFIEDDDDVVATVAQGEVVLIYFAALAIYTSEVSDSKEGIYSGVVFGLLLVIVFFAALGAAIYLVLLDVFGYASLRNVYHKARRQGSDWLSGSTSMNWVSFSRSVTNFPRAITKFPRSIFRSTETTPQIEPAMSTRKLHSQVSTTSSFADPHGDFDGILISSDDDLPYEHKKDDDIEMCAMSKTTTQSLEESKNTDQETSPDPEDGHHYSSQPSQ